jgi:hypothetical protein
LILEANLSVFCSPYYGVVEVCRGIPTIFLSDAFLSFLDNSLVDAWIVAVVVSISIILIVVTVMVVFVLVTHAKWHLSPNSDTASEKSSSGSSTTDSPPKMKLMKHIMPQKKVEVVTPSSLDTIVNWDNRARDHEMVL